MNIFASDLQQYIYLLGGLITMIVLIVLLDEQFKIEKKGIIVNSLIIMSFSEILNSIVQLINCKYFFRYLYYINEFNNFKRNNFFITL